MAATKEKTPSTTTKTQTKHSATEQVTKAVSDASDKVTSAAAEAKDHVKTQIDGLAAAARDIDVDLNKVSDDAKEFVRRNPGTSIAIAAGVGLLIGALATQRRR